MFGELRSFGKPIQDCVMVDSVYEQQHKLFDTTEAIIPFTRARITSLVTAACNAYQTSQLGGIHNLKITVTNNTCFLLENVKVKVTYFKATGAVWSVQTIDFPSVRSNSTSSITLPNTTGGTTVKYRIVSIKASSLGITELELE